MTLKDRVDNYNTTFPDYPAMWFSKDWMLGVWNIGNNYKGSGYYGAYPPSYIKRIMSLFPDKQHILHLFSGSLPKGDYTRFDIRQDIDCDVRGTAEQLSVFFPPASFDLILADPPYTEEDALRYGNPMVNRNKVVDECVKVLKPSGHLCWMDMVLPMYSKAQIGRVGEVYISRSTNHRVRAVFIFERLYM